MGRGWSGPKNPEFLPENLSRETPERHSLRESPRDDPQKQSPRGSPRESVSEKLVATGCRKGMPQRRRKKDCRRRGLPHETPAAQARWRILGAFGFSLCGSSYLFRFFYSAFVNFGRDKFANIWARARVRARTRLRAMRRCGSAARCCSCRWP